METVGSTKMNTKRPIQFHLNRVVLYEQAASILMFLVWFVLACFFFFFFPVLYPSIYMQVDVPSIHVTLP